MEHAGTHNVGEPLSDDNLAAIALAENLSCSERPLVLVVDDDDGLRDYLHCLLSGSHEVLTARTAQVALELIARKTPDLVLADVRMPGIDGLDLVRRLRNQCATRTIPIILLSGHADAATKVAGLAAGADDFVAKPFSAVELVARIDSNLKLSRVRQEAAVRERALRLQAESARGRLAFLAEASVLLSSSLDLESTLTQISSVAVPAIADWCAIDLLGEGNRLRRLAVRHSDPQKLAIAHEIFQRFPPRPEDRHGAMNAIRTGISELYPEIPDDVLVQLAQSDEHLSMLRDLGLKSAMVIPLTSRDRNLGCITFVSAESQKQFTSEDLEMAEALGRRIGLAIENAQLYAQLCQANESLESRVRERTRQLAESVEKLKQQISERERAEQALRQSECQMRVFALATNDMLWNWDFATDEVTRSAGIQTKLGYHADEIGRGIDWWVDRVHPEDLEQTMAIISEAKESGKDSCSYQYRLRKRDGSYALIAARLHFVRDESGRAIRGLGASTDITEQARQQAALLDVSRRLMHAEDSERRRIAKELHDSTAQELIVVMLNLQALLDLVEPGSAHAKQIEDSLALLENCAAEIRTLSYVLHPPRLDDAGLAGAIRHYVTGFGERTGIRTTVDLPEHLERLDKTCEIVLFRVVQEALANIHRHSASATASVRLTRSASSIVLEIHDQGRGMPAHISNSATDLSPNMGVGIPGMRERLRQIGGRLEIRSDSRGSTIRAVAPVEQHTT